jgi:murein DD-endopeptidase MepM/ murein hydrolase activator NlpD
MNLVRGSVMAAVVGAALCVGPAQALAIAGVPGGAQAPGAPQAGGSEYGVARITPVVHPALTSIRVPAGATAGPPPPVTLRIDEKGVGTVYVQVKVISLVTHHSAVVATMGWSHTARTLTVAWPAGAQLAPGSYEVSVSAHDHLGVTLLRKAHSSVYATLTVKAPPPKPVAPQPSPAPMSEPGVPTPAQTLADGAVFPVAGPHNFGGPENRFGAAREGHVHQGQDVLTSEGTPDVAPLPGRIESTSYQAGGAGYYAVEHTQVGFDFMFAHCEAGSLAVSAGETVTAGQLLCKAGQTGDATAPHLHFEMWVGGWQAATGHPIDPLPYLEAWEQAG